MLYSGRAESRPRRFVHLGMSPSPASFEQSSSASLPRWARVADVLCAASLVVALAVAEWGGIRFQVAGVRFAATSVVRALMVALVVALVRHLAVPRPPIYKNLPQRLVEMWRLRSLSARRALAALVGTRFAVLCVGYMAVVMVGYSPGNPPLRYSSNEAVNLQARWDANWYFGIANEGYSYRSARATEQQNIVFFPAFPMLMRVVGRVFGRTPTALMFAGTVVSLVAFFWALTLLHRLVSETLGDESVARGSLWLLATYPFALFYGAIYTESLYLVGAVGAFYFMHRSELVRAGAWGLLVGLTRPNGCFLSVSLAMIAMAPWLPGWLAGRSPSAAGVGSGPFRLKAAAPALLAAAMPGIGVLLYSGYIWNLTGDPLAWAVGHAAWGREYRGLTTLATDHWAWFANAGVYRYSSEVPADFLNALGALFVLATVWPVWRRLGPAYAVFILINILPPLAAGGMLSAGRFSSVLFPAFIWLATAVPDRQRPAWNATFMAMQGLNAALFYTWRDLY